MKCKDIMCAICVFLDLCIEQYLKLVYSMLIPCVIAGYVIKIHPDNETEFTRTAISPLASHHPNYIAL
jgi:hypothetical protein